AGERNVVLNEGRRKPGFAVPRFVPELHEKAAWVPQDAGFDDDETGNLSRKQAHGSSALDSTRPFGCTGVLRPWRVAYASNGQPIDAAAHDAAPWLETMPRPGE